MLFVIIEDSDETSVQFERTDMAAGDLPELWLLSRIEGEPDTAALAAAVQQTWSWPGAAAALEACRVSETLVLHTMSPSLDGRRRLDLFTRLLDAVLDRVDARALHWVAAQQVTSPEQFRSRLPQAGPPLAGAVNVRYFQVGGADDTILMDTVGMQAIGLPDLQRVASGTDPEELGRRLHYYVRYMWDNGDVFKDGDTVDGAGGASWRCERAPAHAPPERSIISFLDA